MKAIRFATVGLALLVAFEAHAQEHVISRWYTALLRVDRAALSELLSDNATIRLDDIGITQTKAEFIRSMDEWEAAVEGAAIRHKVESAVGEVTTVLVCYDFPSNEMLMRETFTTRGERIVANTQVTIGDGCNGF